MGRADTVFCLQTMRDAFGMLRSLAENIGAQSYRRAALLIAATAYRNNIERLQIITMVVIKSLFSAVNADAQFRMPQGAPANCFADFGDCFPANRMDVLAAWVAIW